MPIQLTNRFDEALRVAQELHANGDPDTDRSSDTDEPPHISHLLQVAGLVLEAGGDEDQAIAALFHDALETAPTATEAEARETRIREAFGDRPADIVADCTDVAAENGEGWKGRKEQYIHRLWTAADDAAVRVSAADTLQIARGALRDYRTHGEAAWARYEGGRSGTVWLLRALVGAYRYRDVNGQVEELDAIVSTLEEETDLA
jgi:(p)ppGpp synthase/HD superfamily hydrolase